MMGVADGEGIIAGGKANIRAPIHAYICAEHRILVLICALRHIWALIFVIRCAQSHIFVLLCVFVYAPKLIFALICALVFVYKLVCALVYVSALSI